MPEEIPTSDDLSSLTVFEAAELAQLLKETWGVSVSVAGPAAVGEDAGPSMEEHTELAIVLTAAGAKKADVTAEVRAITGLGLEQAWDLVEHAPTVLRQGITRREAGADLARLSSAGAQAVLVRASPQAETVGATQKSSPVARRDGGRARWSTAPNAREEVRQPVTDFRREAELIGVPVAPEPDLSKAEATVERIAENSADLFPDQAAARTFLFDHPIDGSGKTAVRLVQERGAAALLIKLDQMRFGANG